MIFVIRSLKNYVFENKLKITILTDMVDIVNFDEIDHFDDNKIMVRYNNKIIIVKGINLIISKLLESELLISGKIDGIEFK